MAENTSLSDVQVKIDTDEVAVKPKRKDRTVLKQDKSLKEGDSQLAHEAILQGDSVLQHESVKISPTHQEVLYTATKPKLKQQNLVDKGQQEEMMLLKKKLAAMQNQLHAEEAEKAKLEKQQHDLSKEETKLTMGVMATRAKLSQFAQQQHIQHDYEVSTLTDKLRKLQIQEEEIEKIKREILRDYTTSVLEDQHEYEISVLGKQLIEITAERNGEKLVGQKLLEETVGSTLCTYESKGELLTLANGTYREEFSVRAYTHVCSLRAIRDTLWCCRYSAGIDVYNMQQLEQLQHIPCGEMFTIYSCDDTGKDVVVTASNGLFLVSYAGKHKKKVCNGVYWDVCLSGDKLFALKVSSDKILPLHERVDNIVVFNLSSMTKCGEIDTRCCGDDHKFHSIRSGNQYIYVACKTRHSIDVFDEKGSLIKTYSTGIASATIWHVDQDGSMLASGRQDDYSRLYLCTDREWSEPDMRPRPDSVTCVTFTNNTLFLVDSSGNIHKYQQQRYLGGHNKVQ